ncbi:Uncharacterised protein [Mycobacteroides abscessus]|nr:Uncharacterised protein [Mycobacteroides abscessus]
MRSVAEAVNAACGVTFGASTCTEVVAVAVAPRSSVTSSVIVYVPGAS